MCDPFQLAYSFPTSLGVPVFSQMPIGNQRGSQTEIWPSKGATMQSSGVLGKNKF